MSGDKEFTVDSVESTESFLSSNGIDFETIRHPAVMTVEEMVPHKELFGTQDVVMAKHLFLHDKKKKDAKAWLVIAGPDEKIGETFSTDKERDSIQLYLFKKLSPMTLQT